MMVSFIQSNYMGFGSGIVKARVDWHFAAEPRLRGSQQWIRQSANVVEGGKRPFHTIIPAFPDPAGGRAASRKR